MDDLKALQLSIITMYGRGVMDDLKACFQLVKFIRMASPELLMSLLLATGFLFQKCRLLLFPLELCLDRYKVCLLTLDLPHHGIVLYYMLLINSSLATVSVDIRRGGRGGEREGGRQQGSYELAGGLQAARCWVEDQRRRVPFPLERKTHFVAVPLPPW